MKVQKVHTPGQVSALVLGGTALNSHVHELHVKFVLARESALVVQLMRPVEFAMGVQSV